jgi:hypothetical protein
MIGIARGSLLDRKMEVCRGFHGVYVVQGMLSAEENRMEVMFRGEVEVEVEVGLEGEVVDDVCDFGWPIGGAEDMSV